MLFYDELFSAAAQATHRYNKASSACVLSAFMAAFPAGCQQRSVGRLVGHRRPQINPRSLPGHDGKAHGASVGRQADALPPPFSRCPFSYLPDGGPIQAGISHPIDNVASVSCRSSTHYQGLILPSVSSLFLSLGLVLILEGGGSAL